MPLWALWMTIAGVVYAVLLYMASRSVFFPMRHPSGYWEVQNALGAEDVYLTTSDGVKLHAWLIKAPDAGLVTLHLHGNAGNITHRDLAASHIRKARCSVLLLDYRGYGRSEGRPTERGLYRDAEAAYDYLVRTGYSAGKIVLHGESLGTTVAVELAARREVAGVVLEAPFTSARAMAGRVLPLVGPLLIWGFDTKAKMSSLKVPVLIVHGDRDEIVPYELGRELYEAAPEPKSMWTVRGAMHNDLHEVGGAEFSARLSKFYESLFIAR